MRGAALLMPLLVAGAIVLVGLAAAFYPRQSLVLSTQTDRQSYAAGALVSVSVVLDVRGSAAVSITSLCGPDIGFVVVAQNGSTIYNSFTSTFPRFCPQLGTTITLAPGWSESRSLTWNQTDDFGHPAVLGESYSISPYLLGDPSVEPVLLSSRIYLG